MSVLIILLIASITVASIFLFAFLWSVKHGQFDDEISPPYRMLFDDMVPVETTEIAIATTVEQTETSNQ